MKRKINPIHIVIVAMMLGLSVHFGRQLFMRYYTPPLPPTERAMHLTIAPIGPEDWPAWRGARRDGISLSAGLLTEWPKEGPKLLWTFENAGSGYSTPAIVGDKVFVAGDRGAGCYVIALDAATGAELGDAAIGSSFNNDWGSGPRATPTVDGDRIYAVSGGGDLACIKASDGTTEWRQNIYRQFGGEQPFWGCGESPLVDGDLVICTPGGSSGTIMALNKKTGDLAWRCTEFKDRADYASLVATDAGKVRHYVQMTHENVVGVAADNGRLLWKVPRDGPKAPIPTPVIFEDYAYVTSSYGAGCNLLQLSRDGDKVAAKEVYANKVMKNHYGGVVLIDGHIYGYSDAVGWVCQDFQTGKMVWREKTKFGKGSVVYAENRLYCFCEEDGSVCLIDTSPNGWNERGRFVIPRQSSKPRNQGKIWTHPVIANGRLYLRDQELIFCYDIKAP